MVAIEFRNKPLLFWAVVDYHRWWIAFDRIELNRLEEAGGVHSAASVKRIARRFSVIRGIPETDGVRKKIAKGLDGLSDKWAAQSLIERAESCCKLAEKAKKMPSMKRAPYSAITKLMWFVHPRGWTMFDQFAANGLGIGKGTSKRRCLKFYERLDELSFRGVCEAGNAVIEAAGWKDLFMERVLDGYLMMSAYDDERWKDVFESTAAYPSVYPRDYREEVIQVADEVVRVLGDNPLGIKKATRELA